MEHGSLSLPTFAAQGGTRGVDNYWNDSFHMSPAPIPMNEDDRLSALKSYKILDTDAEQAFDDLTLLASQICQTPVALVSFVDSDRQWFKSRVGVEAVQTPRDAACCAHAILSPDELFVVDSALQDDRFADNPLVTGEPEIRFYAGAPLTTSNGHALGTLCVIDTKPRQLTPEQMEGLRALSRQVIVHLELRRAREELKEKSQAQEPCENHLEE